ncbi:hypothetical protein EV714DRAFT_277921 [Schizophyllum commune]
MWLRLALKVFACVCVTWRAVALSTPQLWARIDVTSHARVIRIQLSRSGGSPLTIVYKPRFEDVDNAGLWSALNNLNGHAARWECINLAAQCAAFSLIPQRELPSLKRADITLRGLYMPGALHFLRDAPRLQSLNLTLGYKVGNTMAAIEPLFMPSFLTSLVLTSHNPRRVEASPLLLQQYPPTLERLEIHGDWTPSDTSTISISPKHFPNLHTAFFERHTHRVLQYIVAPRLRHLTFRFSIRFLGDGDPLSSLLEFLRNSPECALHTLDLDMVVVEDVASFLQCAERLAELKQLRIIGMFCAGVLMVQDTLRRMTVDDSENVPLFPKLESLCMRYEITKLRDSVTAVAARSLCASRREACVRSGIAIAKLDDVDIDILGEDELPAVSYNRYL